jgi:hypothetical protein
MDRTQVDFQALDVLLDDLDYRSEEHDKTETSDDYWVCQRKFPRNRFRMDCLVYFLATMGSTTVLNMGGRTRNLSRNGVGLLVRRPFSLGDPLEVQIAVPGRSVLYMAGLTAFCRYAGRGYHEIGVRLKTASPNPIFSRNPLAAMRSLDWLRPASKLA